MKRISQFTNQHLPDVVEFLEKVKSTPEFTGNKNEIFVTRAPGRLDVMGGIADYSGSLVLEKPIQEAAFAALQKSDSRDLKIICLGADENNRSNSFKMLLDEFETGGGFISYEEAKAKFNGKQETSWAAYIAGAFLVLMRERGSRFSNGATILIDSKVPEGKGVSSSAAIEVAAMTAIAVAFNISLNPREIAILCQKVENLIVGAPCGIMDQMSSSCGEENKLLAMICQPAELLQTRPIPAEIAVWGLDSGICHSVGGGDYGSVRTGAFIGYRIIADLAGLQVEETEIEGVVKIDDPHWHGYLANIKPDEFEKNFAPFLPSEISGAEFLSKFKGITDSVTKINPDKTYQVFQPTAHPVYENFRVNQFAALLSKDINESELKNLGDLMYQSHASYSGCGLGTNGTDLLVDLVRNSPNLFGAKITGGGSGGTVAVLGKKGADDEVKKIAAMYHRQTGYDPYIFSGSSLGAGEFGYIKLGK